jgi:hypothetical protein
LIGEQTEAGGAEFNGLRLFSARGNHLKRSLAMGPPMPAPLVCIASSALIDPARLLHERLKPRLWGLAPSNIPQRPSPFADHLVVGSIATRAVNDRSKGISFFVERQISKLKRAPQQFVGSSPHFEMHDDGEYGLQIIVHGVTTTIGLKFLPRKLDLLEPSAQSSFRRLVASKNGPPI